MTSTKLSDAEVEKLGLGDLVADATKAVGIKPCAGCEERRKKLNRAVPNVRKRKRRR